MHIKVYPDTQSAGRGAARVVAALAADKPDAALGLATGHTMIPVYGELVRLHEDEGLSLARVKTFNLDEYAGLGKGHPDSYYEYMMTRLVQQTDLAEENMNVPDGRAEDLEAECRRHEEAIERAGGLDLQLLGLGKNGHIGFNEPGSALDSRTRTVELAADTRQVNSGDFRAEPGAPERALTMGIGTILDARSILLVVTGWEKAGILHRVLTGRPDPAVPATALHLHRDVTVVADREAMEEHFEKEGDRGVEFVVSGPR